MASGFSLAMIVSMTRGRDRFDVGGVGEVGVGHDRGRVRVDQDDAHALLAQHAAGLRARVVELGTPGRSRWGLEPMTRTERMSSRLALVLVLAGSTTRSREAVEQVVGVVRTGRRPPGGTARRTRGCRGPQALRRTLVVEVDVAHLDAAVALRATRRRSPDGRVDGETVVVRGDLDASRWRARATGWLMPRWPNGSL